MKLQPSSALRLAFHRDWFALITPELWNHGYYSFRALRRYIQDAPIPGVTSAMVQWWVKEDFQQKRKGVIAQGNVIFSSLRNGHIRL
jgi:hypothetical protein